MQDTYARRSTAAASFDGSNLKAWLLRILRNAFIDGLAAAQAVGGLDEAAAEWRATGRRRAGAAAAARRGRSGAGDATLSEDARTVILLDLEGLTEVEVATVVGCAVGTVKSRLARARSLLRARLEEKVR